MSQGFTRGIPISTNGALSENSDFLVSSQKAVKTYVDTEIAAIPAPTTPDLEDVLTQGNDGGGLEITNIADGTAATSAATVGQLVFTQHVMAGQANLGSSLTLHFGDTTSPPGAAGSDDGRWGIYLPVNCEIIMAEIRFVSVSAIGTSEDISVYIRVNSTTDYLIATLGAATRLRRFTNTAMSIALAPTDYFTIKFVTPVFVTAPTAINFQGTVYLKPTP